MKMKPAKDAATRIGEGDEVVNHTIERKVISNLHKAEIAALLDFSARVGRDQLLVQASSGNTSIKLDGVLWIKASGKWLANADREDIVVPVDLSIAREALRAGTEIPRMPWLGSTLKPSIETPLHVAMPHRVVVHVHSINTIAWAVRRDAPEQLAKRLAGLNWQWIRYVASGIPLAAQIEKALCRCPMTNVFILANHGLVICGEDCAAVEALLRDIECRLGIAPRRSPDPEPALAAVIARSSEWHLPNLPALHALGTDPVSRKILHGGILYPCQAIFLGLKIRTLPHSVPLSRFAEYSNGRDGARTFVVVDGGGVIIHKQITDAQLAILTGLVQVIQRTEEHAPLRYLNAEDLTDLSGTGPHPYLANIESGNETRDIANPF